MKRTVLSALLGVCSGGLLALSNLSSQPSFNMATPGCGSGGGCHTVQAGIVSVTPQAGLNLNVSLTGVSAGQAVAGELVNASGTVVAVVNQTTNNPFTLTAPSVGTYVVNAGYKQPQRLWDSVRVNISPTSVGEHTGGTPDNAFSLDQNYPNPFNPSTTIAFTMGTAGFATLKVLDLEGREVRTAVNGELAAGRHEIGLTAGDLPSGVYLYRLQTPGYTQTRKMLMVK